VFGRWQVWLVLGLTWWDEIDVWQLARCWRVRGEQLLVLDWGRHELRLAPALQQWLPEQRR